MYDDGGALAGLFGGSMLIVQLVVLVISIAVMWKLFVKAGKPGWACLIPIYNWIVILEIIERPLWWFLLLCIPVVNIIFYIIITFDFAKAYGKDIGYGFGLLFLSIIFGPILAFGDAQYTGVQRF